MCQTESEVASFWIEHEASKQKFAEHEESRLAQSKRKLTDKEEDIIVKETARRLRMVFIALGGQFHRLCIL